VPIFTIGFTQKPASRFFSLVRENRIDVLVDIRRHPDGQLAGFAKRADLPFFLAELAGSRYQHVEALAPTDEILKDYRSNKDWAAYTARFEALMDERGVPDVLDRSLFADNRCCLLCSEAMPEQCHRRLVAERLAAAWDIGPIIHLV
jgi:uncharacterized protein (DUF488 family)